MGIPQIHEKSGGVIKKNNIIKSNYGVFGFKCKHIDSDMLPKKGINGKKKSALKCDKKISVKNVKMRNEKKGREMDDEK